MAIVYGQSYLRRTLRDWSQAAGSEPIRVAAIGSMIYAFGSELAMLRLYRYYRGAPNVSAEVNRGDQRDKGSWYFRLQLKNAEISFGHDWMEI
jgi:hypothetical protein